MPWGRPMYWCLFSCLSLKRGQYIGLFLDKDVLCWDYWIFWIIEIFDPIYFDNAVMKIIHEVLLLCSGSLALYFEWLFFKFCLYWSDGDCLLALCYFRSLSLTKSAYGLHNFLFLMPYWILKSILNIVFVISELSSFNQGGDNCGLLIVM